MAVPPWRAAIQRLQFRMSDPGPDAPLEDPLPEDRSGAGVPEFGADAAPDLGVDTAPPSEPRDATQLIHVTPPVFEELNLEDYEALRSRPEDRQDDRRRDEQRRHEHRHHAGRHDERWQERKMIDRLSCSAAGITEVLLDTFLEDAKVRSSDEIEEIVVTVKRDGPAAPELVVDGDKVRVTGPFVTRIEVPHGIAVTIEDVMGDLKVPRFEGDLRIGNVYGDLRIESVTGRVEIGHIYGDVRAEDVADMQVMECDADFRFSGGDLQVETVNGDLRVVDAGSFQGLRLHGDLGLERLSGGVKIEAAHGDVRLKDIEGPADLGMVAGDFRATNVRGALNVGQVHGDTQLEGPFPAGEGYTVSTSGDAHIRLMAEDDVRLVVRAMGRVRSNLPLIPSADGSTTYTASVGEGRVQVVLTANGDLRIEAAAGGREEVRGPWDRRRGPGGDPFADLSGLGERIRQQVTASLAAAGINPDTGEINFGLGRGRGSRGRPPEPPDRPPRPPRPGVPHGGPQAAAQSGGTMTSEQMAVLKMLEEGRISPEEADALLRALGA